MVPEKFLKNFKKYKTFLQPLCHIGETNTEVAFFMDEFPDEMFLR